MEVTQDIQTICQELLDRYINNIKDSGHNASGALANTATYYTDWNGRYFSVTFNLQEYWKYIENGTSPHFPPIDAIENWIKVKKIAPRVTGKKAPTTRQLAYAICKSISEKGTPATNLLKDTIDNSEDLIQKLCDVLINEIKKEIDTEL